MCTLLDVWGKRSLKLQSRASCLQNKNAKLCQHSVPLWRKTIGCDQLSALRVFFENLFIFLII